MKQEIRMSLNANNNEKIIAPVVNSDNPPAISMWRRISAEDTVNFILLIFLLITVFIIRSNFLSTPFERDEGIYSYYGKLLCEGKIPYKDFYEQKFPGLFYLYAMVVSLFGDTLEGMHRGFLWINISTILFLFFGMRRLFSASAGIISAIAFSFLSLTTTLSGFTIQAEHGVALFISLGFLFYAYAKHTGHWYHYFCMGVAMGCAFMVKTSGVFLVVGGGLIIISDFLFSKDKKIKTLLINAGSYGGGGLLVLSIFFLIIIAKGSFNEMIFWTYYIPKRYVSKVPFDQGIEYLKMAFSGIYDQHEFFWISAVLALGLIFLPTVGRATKGFILLMFVSSMLTISPGFYFYGHYFIQTLPGIAILSGFTYFALSDFIATKFRVTSPLLKYGLLGIFLMFDCTHVQGMKDYYFSPDVNEVVRGVYGPNPFPEAYEIAQYLNAHSKPEDQVMVFGSEPEIYFYMKKKSPSRHAYFSAIVDNLPEHRQWQREFVNDVERVKPKYIIVFKNKISLLAQPNTDDYVFNWLNKYTTDFYFRIGIVDQLEGGDTKYLWKEQMKNYRPVSNNLAFIMERR